MTDVISAVGTAATVIALIWAVIATVRAKQDLAEETRRQFELGLLADMWNVLSQTGEVTPLRGYAGALVRDRNDCVDLRLLRAYLGVKPDSAGQSLLTGMDQYKASDSELIRAVEAEIDQAIDRRVSGRQEYRK